MTSAEIDPNQIQKGVPRGTLSFYGHPYNADHSFEQRQNYNNQWAYAAYGTDHREVMRRKSHRFPQVSNRYVGQHIYHGQFEGYIGKTLYLMVSQDDGKTADFDPAGLVTRVIPINDRCVQLVLQLPNRESYQLPPYSPKSAYPTSPCPVQRMIEKHLPCQFSELGETCAFHEYTANNSCPDLYRQCDGKNTNASLYQLFFGQMPNFYCACLMRHIIEAHAEVYNVYFEGTNTTNHHRHIHLGSSKEVARIHHALHKRVVFDTCGYWYAKDKEAINHMMDFEYHRRASIRPCIALPMSSLVAELPTRH